MTIFYKIPGFGGGQDRDRSHVLKAAFLAHSLFVGLIRVEMRCGASIQHTRIFPVDFQTVSRQIGRLIT